MKNSVKDITDPTEIAALLPQFVENNAEKTVTPSLTLSGTFWRDGLHHHEYTKRGRIDGKACAVKYGFNWEELASKDGLRFDAAHVRSIGWE